VLLLEPGAAAVLGANPASNQAISKVYL